METISMGFALTQEAFEDNLYDSLSTRYSRELGRAMRNTKEIKAVVPFNTGFTALASGGYGVGDGVPLYSTAHPQVAGHVEDGSVTVGRRVGGDQRLHPLNLDVICKVLHVSP
jgi:hypothetical protein